MDPSDRDTPGRSPSVYWVIAALLAVIAAGLWLRPTAPCVPTALAQVQPALAGGRGVFAFSGPIDRDRYGLFMLDIDQGTIWCYALDNVDGTSKMRLVAARTWIYDRYLQDFNCAAPDFRAVQKLVGQQRAAAAPAGLEESAQPGPQAKPEAQPKPN